MESCRSDDPSRLKDAIDEQIWFLRVFGKVFLAFALIAMLMSSVGIYAVIAHATNAALGRSVYALHSALRCADILLLVMRRGLWQIAVGLVSRTCSGIPVAHLMASLPVGGLRADPFLTFRLPFRWLRWAFLRAGCRPGAQPVSIR